MCQNPNFHLSFLQPSDLGEEVVALLVVHVRVRQEIRPFSVTIKITINYIFPSWAKLTDIQWLKLLFRNSFLFFSTQGSYIEIHHIIIILRPLVFVDEGLIYPSTPDIHCLVHDEVLFTSAKKRRRFTIYSILYEFAQVLLFLASFVSIKTNIICKYFFWHIAYIKNKMKLPRMYSRCNVITKCKLTKILDPVFIWHAKYILNLISMIPFVKILLFFVRFVVHRHDKEYAWPYVLKCCALYHYTASKDIYFSMHICLHYTSIHV